MVESDSHDGLFVRGAAEATQLMPAPISPARHVCSRSAGVCLSIIELPAPDLRR